jgi:hypothetical protein
MNEALEDYNYNISCQVREIIKQQNKMELEIECIMKEFFGLEREDWIETFIFWVTEPNHWNAEMFALHYGRKYDLRF